MQEQFHVLLWRKRKEVSKNDVNTVLWIGIGFVILCFRRNSDLYDVSSHNDIFI